MKTISITVKPKNMSLPSPLPPKNKTSFLSETFSDYGVKEILGELIEFILSECPDQLHFAILSA